MWALLVPPSSHLGTMLQVAVMDAWCPLCQNIAVPWNYCIAPQSGNSVGLRYSIQVLLYFNCFIVLAFTMLSFSSLWAILLLKHHLVTRSLYAVILSYN